MPPDAPNDGAYVKYDPTTLEYARYAGDVIRRHAEEWEGYQKRFPQMIDKKIFLRSMSMHTVWVVAADQEARISNRPWPTAMLFNEMMRHTDFITMGAHTMGTSSLDITPTDVHV